jgi:hypothetical protein
VQLAEFEALRDEIEEQMSKPAHVKQTSAA